MIFEKSSLVLFLLFTSIGFSQHKQDTLTLGFHIKHKTSTTSKSKATSIPVETMFGNRKVNYLSILNVRFRNSGKFAYFSVNTVVAPYDTSNASNELVLSNSLTYKLTNKLFATGGLQYHFLKGVAPTAGFQLFSGNPKWLIVLSPSVAFAKNTSLQNVGIVEFKPKLSNSLKLYSRLQGIYNINLQSKLHERSLVYLRTGITLQKTSLGFGFNMDFYGPQKTKQENFGIFIHHLL